VALTWGAYYKLWYEGVRDGASGSVCPAVKTWYEKDSTVRWERRKELPAGRTNRSTASRMKKVVWYMDTVILEKEKAGLSRADAVDEMAKEFTAKWKNDKCKAAQACAEKFAAAAAAAGRAPEEEEEE
jgi:hypothetical protein